MDKIRAAIVQTLKDKFPAMVDSIAPYTGLLDEQSENQISYAAPGILVCILPLQEAPDTIAPWPLQAEFGLVVVTKAASAVERDIKGWRLCMEVAQVVYRNRWGFQGSEVCPAVITNIQKNERKSPASAPSGINYWTIMFHNYVKFEAML